MFYFLWTCCCWHQFYQFIIHILWFGFLHLKMPCSFVSGHYMASVKMKQKSYHSKSSSLIIHWFEKFSEMSHSFAMYNASHKNISKVLYNANIMEIWRPEVYQNTCISWNLFMNVVIPSKTLLLTHLERKLANFRRITNRSLKILQNSIYSGYKEMSQKSNSYKSESKQMLDPQSRAGQKWQRIGCLTSGRAYVNKNRLYGPLY